MKIFANFSLLIFALGAVGTSHAGKMQDASTARRSGNAISFASAPLDTDVEVLPSHFLGHSCREIAKRLLTLKPQKSEFETTVQYTDRMESHRSTLISGSASLDSIFGFSQSNTFLDQKYDADSGALHINAFWGESRSSVGNDLISSTMLDSSEKSRRTYNASNAYGKSVQVSSIHSYACGLALKNVSYLRSGSHTIDLLLEMPPEEGRASKGKLSLLYVGRLDV